MGLMPRWRHSWEMSMKIFNRYKRYAKYMFQWIFVEKIRGLDFSMRDLSLINASGGELHGYSKTDESHAKMIFESLSKLENIESLSLLDVGCGKGAFLREASRYPFEKIAGIEYLENLAEIARKNFRILKLKNRIHVECADAAKYDRYGEYNVFYFFNPFEPDLMETTIKSIREQCRGKNIWVILHNPVSSDVIFNNGGVEKLRLYDKVKSYETIIYQLNC